MKKKTLKIHLKDRCHRANLPEMESICSLWQGITCPSQRGYKSCTNRSATITRSSDTMSRLKLRKLQPGKTAGRYWWRADNAAVPTWWGGCWASGEWSSGRTVGCGGDARLEVLASHNNVCMLTWKQCCCLLYCLNCNTLFSPSCDFYLIRVSSDSFSGSSLGETQLI